MSKSNKTAETDGIESQAEAKWQTYDIRSIILNIVR